MSVKVNTVETVIGHLATSQHGVVTRAQVLNAGLTRHQIEHRLLVGALLCVYRGVYRVGHRAPSVDATYLAAVLACGEGARLSGRAAAPPARPPEAPRAAAGGDRAAPAARARRPCAARTDRPPRAADAPRHPDHGRPAHADRPGRGPSLRCPRASLPRGRRPVSHTRAHVETSLSR